MICSHDCVRWKRCSIMDLNPGKECNLVEPVEYYYESVASPGKWKLCFDEVHCMQMAKIGYNVKKVMREIVIGV